ncbi:phasin family protein [Duganella sp. Dugasp56]|uniref:phasin family protein n=1 Tax=Duganella sp. Dugasp56 TaxID=3243046 RepID=UPI0039AF84F2
MAKKLKKNDDQQTTEVVRMSSQEIWQAGLSAFAKAQEEEGKFFSMQLFEERVLRALSSIGVPTAKEVEALSLRIDELTKQVAALTPKPAPKKAAAKPAAKPATKPAAKAAKKPAAKPTTRAKAKTAAK